MKNVFEQLEISFFDKNEVLQELNFDGNWLFKDINDEREFTDCGVLHSLALTEDGQYLFFYFHKNDLKGGYTIFKSFREMQEIAEDHTRCGPSQAMLNLAFEALGVA